MKHLLKILSILLLSFPVFGDNQKGKTLYRWDTSSGIQWKVFGEKEIHHQYRGEFQNGKPNGVGIFIYPDGRKYVGEFKDGKQNGQGTITFSSGTKYVGGFKGGEKSGQGTYTWSGGSKYIGEWKDCLLYTSPSPRD